MKQFLKILEFELTGYFKSKGYVLTTVLVSAFLIIGLSLPSFFDLSGILPFLDDDKNNTSQGEINEEISEDDLENLAILDKNKLVDSSYLSQFFPNAKWTTVSNEGEIKELIKEDKVNSGFVVNSITDFDYLIEDSSFGDHNQTMFNEMLSLLNRMKYASDNNLNFEELESVYNTPINSDVTILGKDGVSNYAYAYMLVMILYFMIIMYGQLVAVSVTNEKSNRSIEILVTSVDTTSLISGKVIAASLASFIQFGTIIASGVISYSINKDAWNGILDNIFAIPMDILLVFMLFGCTGYLFYAFIFGTLGALVSKTEDVSSSIGSITMVFFIVFFIAIFGMQSADSSWFKISSFIPFSSCLTMPTRFTMGSVSTIELGISFAILVLSTIFVAYLASKIYRMATLRYGNPIKLKDAFKLIKKGNS